ncbi:lymphotoxin-alpha [Alosa pseudoharengus]|uniref:lymphotoxin-alpha n=1 Tax=Alosa pseudoharengus TaxID=34774 RepID=UPI003F8C813F
MANQSPWRFLALVIWCGILTITMVILAGFIINMNQKVSTSLPVLTQAADRFIEDPIPFDPPVTSAYMTYTYIHMIMGDNLTWKSSNSVNTSLKLEDNSVTIKLTGLYLFYGQVTFTDEEGTVNLFLDRTTYKAQRGISKAVKPRGNGHSCVTITGVHQFKLGDKVKLNVTSKSPFMEDADKTYWGLYLLYQIN